MLPGGTVPHHRPCHGHRGQEGDQPKDSLRPSIANGINNVLGGSNEACGCEASANVQGCRDRGCSLGIYVDQHRVDAIKVHHSEPAGEKLHDQRCGQVNGIIQQPPIDNEKDREQDIEVGHVLHSNVMKVQLVAMHAHGPRVFAIQEMAHGDASRSTAAPNAQEAKTHLPRIQFVIIIQHGRQARAHQCETSEGNGVGGDHQGHVWLAIHPPRFVETHRLDVKLGWHLHRLGFRPVGPFCPQRNDRSPHSHGLQGPIADQGTKRLRQKEDQKDHVHTSKRTEEEKDTVPIPRLRHETAHDRTNRWAEQGAKLKVAHIRAALFLLRHIANASGANRDGAAGATRLEHAQDQQEPVHIRKGQTQVGRQKDQERAYEDRPTAIGI